MLTNLTKKLRLLMPAAFHFHVAEPETIDETALDESRSASSARPTDSHLNPHLNADSGSISSPPAKRHKKVEDDDYEKKRWCVGVPSVVSVDEQRSHQQAIFG